MNVLKYAVAVALMSCAIVHADAYARQGESVIPSNVRAVYPEPDRRVNLGPTQYPMGVQYISVAFDDEITLNTACTAEAHIYRDGEEEPFQSVGVSGATVDFIDNTVGAVLFPYSCTYNDSYRVTIPEGFWIISGSRNAPLDLYYEIYNPQRITPADPIVKELSEFRLEFPDCDVAEVLDAGKIEFFRLSSAERYGLTVTGGLNEDGTPANFILIRLDEPVTVQGEYSLYVQEGAAQGIVRGGSHDPAEVASAEPNTEALYRYTVSLLDMPAISPEEGMIEAISQFELTVPGGADFWFINDKAVSFIYPVNDDGTLAPDPICRLTGTRPEGTDNIVLTISGDGKHTDSFAPAPGRYALQLASGLFSGSWDGEFINSAPFVYYYQVTGEPGNVGVRPADTHSATDPLYRIDGLRIEPNGGSLPKGIYVVGGKKVMVGG